MDITSGSDSSGAAQNPSGYSQVYLNCPQETIANCDHKMADIYRVQVERHYEILSWIESCSEV